MRSGWVGWRSRIATSASRAFDNVTKKDVEVRPVGIDLTHGEVDLHLLDHHGNEAELVTPAGRVTVRGSAEYTHWVVWTQPGKDFICLEPFWGKANTINTDTRLEVPPAEVRELWVRIELAG